MTPERKEELRKEFDEFIDKETFQVPYDGSSEFYDKKAISCMKSAADWWLSKIEANEYEPEKLYERIPLEINFEAFIRDYPNKKITEWTYMPSGLIVVMADGDSFWFDRDGKSPKGSYIIFNNSYNENKSSV